MTILTPDITVIDSSTSKNSSKEHDFPLRTVEHSLPIEFRGKPEDFGWIKDPGELITHLRLVYNPDKPNQSFLLGNLIRGKKLTEPLKLVKDSYADQSNRIADVICMELLSNGDCHKTRLFRDVLTRKGNCFYGRGGRDVRTWVLRVEDVRVNGKAKPCFLKIATCLADDEPVIISSLCGISIDEARKRANK